MATIFSPFFENLRGKVGNLILYKARGQVRMRGNQEAMSIPWSKTQQLQQSRLRAAVAFYRANADTALPHIWREAARGKVMSGYNLFLQENMAVFDGEFRIGDYAGLHVSHGWLEFPQGLRVADYGDGKVRVEWRNLLPPTSLHMADRLHALWLPDDGTFSLREPALPLLTREAGAAVLPLAEAGHRGLHLYLYFSDKEEKRFSPDRHFYLPALR